LRYELVPFMREDGTYQSQTRQSSRML
jgi:hypothetical protein